MTANLLTKQSAHSVIILAAGLSRRLGQSKQLLTQQGQTLLAKAIDMALNTKPISVVVVVPKPFKDSGQGVLQSIAQEVIQETIQEVIQVQTVCANPSQSPHIYLVQNSAPETGLAESLKLGISKLAEIQRVDDKHAQFKRALIMGVDQILLEVQHLDQLLAGNLPVVASEYPISCEVSQYKVDEIGSTSTANRSQTAVKLITGLPLVIDFKLLQSWQAKLSGDKGLRDLIRTMPSEYISRVRNDPLSFDIDTPAQLAYARAQGWLDGDVKAEY